jgi:hypothetical protein
MHARVRGEVNDQIMCQALDAIQDRHPLLQVRIERGGRANLRFSPENIPRIPLRVVGRAPESWVEEAENNVNAIFQTAVGPLIHATLVRHGLDLSAVSLAFHYSIGDVMSGAYLIRDLFAPASLGSEGKHENYPPFSQERRWRLIFQLRLKEFAGAAVRLDALLRLLKNLRGSSALRRNLRRAAEFERFPCSFSEALGINLGLRSNFEEMMRNLLAGGEIQWYKGKKSPGKLKS